MEESKGTPTMEKYITRTGLTQFRPSAAQLIRIIEGENSSGFCLACGTEADGIEPDARKYRCETCNAEKVYGAEELLMMGIYH